MSIDTNASDRMKAWGARLMASATMTALIGDETALYYPDVPALTGDTPAAFPFAVLYREKYQTERSAPGEHNEGSGNSFSAVIYFDPDVHSVAQVEKAVEAICEEIVESEAPDTLDVIRAECTRASNPSESQKAAGADSDGRSYRTIVIVGWYS